ncbi:MAG TPA: class I SAM-dependent rRNA methyltransferase, partial [Anaeromyxobacter sp.]
MKAEAELRLQKDLARHLRAGHPWVFRKAIEKAPKGLAAGAIVDVTDDGRFVARGYLDPHSAITVRILTRDQAEEIDDAFWRRRIARAL